MNTIPPRAAQRQAPKQVYDRLLCGLSLPVDQLRALARHLHANGADPLEILFGLLPESLRLGLPAPVAADLVRELPGLGGFNAKEAWSARWKARDVLRAMEERWRASEWFQKQVARQQELPAMSVEDRRHEDRGRRIVSIIRGHEEQICEAMRPWLQDEIREVLVEDLPDAVAALTLSGGRHAKQ